MEMAAYFRHGSPVIEQESVDDTDGGVVSSIRPSLQTSSEQFSWQMDCWDVNCILAGCASMDIIQYRRDRNERRYICQRTLAYLPI
mmetsp:Transcript_5946/g.10278  ORF Transcript_5946/g.10278 Transcript_5946/m.10278 type:complete len:86 (-) Transcript_5946:2-259(-)